ncbi:phosphatidylglycerol lysyltransferase domain-containing protein [Parachlamydia sp. AcF125]|uniref:phosphatidylglycerol lysyltransferase domain-containing protein n=1 Tax=Parachlamydia sp. AcF125 TaxID=2795736 RepID=UPI001BD8344B|nr:phosphatidylglycerol lysyltransferase domain-containing protein [Parachlamydia sp. AcF125]MBS4167516.1 hypothetical protein [Parachlamydia sp. AcF125]
MDIHEVNEKEKKLFIRYGSAASEAMFDFPCHFFRIPSCQGVIAYRIEYGCAIVFGEPICPPRETSMLVEAFHYHCQEENLNIIYIIVSEKFAKWAKSSYCNILIEACSELIFDPEIDPCLASNRLRHRVEKASKRGLTVHEYIPFDAEIEDTLKHIGVKWHKAIKGPHIYLGHLNFFESYMGKRWFYAKEGEKITGMIMLSRVEASHGWLLKFLTTSPDASPATSEFLMTSVLEILRKENCRFLSKGTAPANFLGEVSGLGYISMHILSTLYKVISKIFKFEKRKEYWLRYGPKVVPSYLLFHRPHIGLNEIRALMKVFKTMI